MSADTFAWGDREIEQVAIGASIAAGCQVCFRYHLRAGRAVGAEEEDLRRAVELGLAVSRTASARMATLAGRELGSVDGPEISADAGPGSDSPIEQLIRLGAAIAANDVAGVRDHLASARRLGAGDNHIRVVAAMARAVKDMARGKAEAGLPEFASPAVDCADDCACHTESEPASAPAEACCANAWPEVSA